MVPKRRFVVVVVGALALAACGSGDGGGPTPASSGAPVPTTATTATAGIPGTTTTPAPGPAVTRPGPPATGRCSVTVDAAAPPAARILVRSAVPGAPFLVRATGGPTVLTGSGTTDGTGSGAAVLDLAGVPAGATVLVEASVAGGAEECSVSYGGPP